MGPAAGRDQGELRARAHGALPGAAQLGETFGLAGHHGSAGAKGALGLGQQHHRQQRPNIDPGALDHPGRREGWRVEPRAEEALRRYLDRES